MDIKILNLDACNTHAEVNSAVRSHIASVDLKELLKEVNKTFYNHSKTVRAIYYGLGLNSNIYLHGRGGYGKSEILKHILGILKIPYTVISGYKDMPVDKLLGVPDFKKFMEESVYEVAFEKSVFRAPGILIGEEFGDILPSTAVALKDILSDNGYRDKGSKIDSLISSMIITSNRSPEELSEDASNEALYVGRFPIRVEVMWESHDRDDYISLFARAAPHVNSHIRYFLSGLLEYNAAKSNVIPPRLALEIMHAIHSYGYSSLKIYNIDISAMQRLLAEADEATQLTTELDILLKYVEDIDEAIKVSDFRSIAKILALVNTSTWRPDNADIVAELLTKGNGFLLK